MFGYFLAIITGLTLGLLGGGGSVLTVPILVYALKMEPKLAIALSLAIVGSSSLIGVFGHYRNKNIDFKAAIIFGPIAMAFAVVGARLSHFLNSSVQMTIFALVMIIAATFMFKSGKYDEQKSNGAQYPFLALGAVFVGLLTGLIGVGGGFLIVPSLIFLADLPMKRAVGTSLLVISLNSLAGFLGHLGAHEIPWRFLIIFSLLTSVGIIGGTKLIAYIPQKRLKKIFALFLMCMGIFIMFRNYLGQNS